MLAHYTLEVYIVGMIETLCMYVDTSFYAHIKI